MTTMSESQIEMMQSESILDYYKKKQLESDNLRRDKNIKSFL
jgi:hypothetical protein